MFTLNRFIARNVGGCCPNSAAVTGRYTVGLCRRASSGDAPSVTVRYGDLNLTSKEGIASLYRRIGKRRGGWSVAHWTGAILCGRRSGMIATITPSRMPYIPCTTRP